jgi:peptidoglycan/xylan/chitin deacetylase (PgdA/CDA1 family)
MFSALAIYISIVVYGSSQIKANYFVKSINKGSTNGITLTFDDGPHPDITPKILEVLSKENVKAAFFLIGKNAERYSSLVNEILQQGHTIANHSYCHQNAIGFFSESKLKEDFEKCNRIIKNISGKQPAFFRPPFGVTNPRYANVIKKLNLNSIGWSIRSMDTKATSKELLLKKITSSLTNGSIVLLHDTQQVTLETLPSLIQHCKSNNIKIVSLPELINKEPYV